MASIRKRGNSYQITVSNGYDVSGKKIIETTTYLPNPTLSPKKQKESLDKFVFEFEQKVKNGKLLKGDKLTLQEDTEQWWNQYAIKNLEKTTLSGYRKSIDYPILPALEHLKLSDIKPLHVQSFYNNLTEDGIRKDNKQAFTHQVQSRKLMLCLVHAFNSCSLATDRI